MMNATFLPPDAADESIGDQNLEYLLSKAYHPEVPDAEFAARVQAAMVAEASERRTSVAGSPRLTFVRRFVAGAAMAAAVLVAIGLSLEKRPIGRRAGAASGRESFEVAGSNPMHRPGWPDAGLTPRPRAHATTITAARPGDTISTHAGERRRVPLTDGSVLYLNEKTSAKIDTYRRVTLTAGEAFVEVAPRAAEEGHATFTVETPGRTVSALGTKFAVRVEPAGTGVVVSQGKVEVSGLDALLTAGQQLLPGGGEVAAAPRISAVLDWTRELMADAESPLVPANRFAGGALVATDQWGRESKLSLRKYHVDVYIEDGFARTTIDQTYFNHEHWQLEGTFYFPLPPDASLNRLAMYVDSKLMEGGMVERDRARDIFETIRYANRDPALLEWVDGSTFKMRVFPLEARQEKRLILSYVQKLPLLFGKMQYRFPTGHSLDVVRDWSFHALVKNGAEQRWNCASHTLTAANEGRDLVLTAAGKQVKLDKDITLEISPLVPGDENARFVSATHDGARYLGLRFRPELVVQPQRQRRDWVFLFESSADRDPLLARVQVEIVRTLLANAEHDDTFSVVTAGTYVGTFHDEPQPLTTDNADAAMAFLERTHLIGALDLGQALKAAEPILQKAQNPYLVHLGAGIPALGETREKKLLRRIPENAKYIGIGVGKRWARNFMKTAAERSGGFFTQINPDESVTWRAFDLLATLNTPRLLNVKVVDDAEKAVFLTDAATLTQGEELLAVARLESGAPLPESVTVSGTLNGQPYSRTISVGDVAEHADYLPRTWAKLEIDRLLAESAERNQAKIVALSKAMYVMTPFTSLLVLENEEMYQRFNVDRGRKDHWAMYPCPERIPVVREPETVAVADKPRPAENKERARNVLPTILIRMPPMLVSESAERESGQQPPNLNASILWDGAFVDDAPMRVGEVIIVGNTIRSYDPVFSLVMRAPSSLNHRIGSAIKKYQPEADQLRGKLKAVEVAMTINISTVSSVAGFIQAGHRVDVFASIQIPTPDGGKPYSQVILQNVEVLATNESPLGRASSATLRLNREQAMLMQDYEARNAFFALLLRPVNDKEIYNTPGRLQVGVSREVYSTNAPDEAPILQSFLPLHSESGQFRLENKWTRGQSHSHFDTDGTRDFSLGYTRRSFSLYDLYDAESNRFYRQKQFTNWGDLTIHRKRRWGDASLTNAFGEWFQEALDIDALLQTPTDKLKTGIEKGTPLKDALDYICRIHNVRPGQSLKYRINHKAFADAGVPNIEETPIELPPMPKVPLAIVFRDLLSRIDPPEAQGTIAIKADYIEITTLTRAWREQSQMEEYHGVPVNPLCYPLLSMSAADFAPQGWHSLLYQRPHFSGDWRIVSDLLAYAPGMNTQAADIAAVLEEEAPDRQSATGTIDPAARELIEKASRWGWQNIALPATGSGVFFRAAEETGPPRGRDPAALKKTPDLFVTICCDGLGRFTFERSVSEGLRERVVCDGKTLWHLYPEIGVGAKRKVSRFHRQALVDVVPWYLPPVDDLACGADVRQMGVRTVAILPRGVGMAEHEEWRLNFAEDGRLTERRLVQMPHDKTLYRETYEADGTVRSFDETGKRLAEQKFTFQPRATPDLQPATRDLVVLPLPYRTRQHVFNRRNIQPEGAFASWSEEDALALLAADLAEGNNALFRNIRERFFDKGDRRQGFLTLLMSLKESSTKSPSPIFDSWWAGLNAKAQFADSPLVKYFLGHSEARDGFAQPAENFLQRLANCRTAVAGVKAEMAPWNALFAYVRTCDSPAFAWTVLSLILDRQTALSQFSRQIAEAAEPLTHGGFLKYAARYEHARYWDQAGDRARAQQLFRDLYRQTLEQGTLPPVDKDFRRAFDEEQWQALMRETADQLIAKGARPDVVALAWQCRQIEDATTAEALLSNALAGISDADRLPTTMAAVRYLLDGNQLARADKLLDEMLSRKPYATDSALWRLRTDIAEKRGMLAQAVKHLDKALGLEFENLPDSVDLEPLRWQYSALLDKCSKLADTVAALQPEPPRELVAIIVRTADRWRLIDPEPTQPCHTAARVLLKLGAADLAWEYLTTPIALKPNESAPWLGLAQLLRDEGNVALADRAYALAFAAEPTNAQILWDRAQLFHESGREEAARALYRQLAERHWQPRFRSVQEQAKRMLEKR